MSAAMWSAPRQVVLALALYAGCSSDPAALAGEDAGGNHSPDLATGGNPGLDAGGGNDGGGTGSGVVRFAAVGDTGKGNDKQKAVAAAIASKCAKDGCDFVQLLGDN